MNVALAIRLKRWRHLEQMGFTETTALRYVMKRRRGLAGAYIGTTVSELLGATENKTQRALQLVTECGAPVARVARELGIDARNLKKLIPEARQTAQIEADRILKFAANTQTANFDFSLIAATVRALFFCQRTPLPK